MKKDYFITHTQPSELLKLDDVWNIWRWNDGSQFKFQYTPKSNKTITKQFYYNDEITRDKDYEEIVQLLANKNGGNMVESIKNYFKKHEETIITIMIVVLIDQFIFKGVFREKLTKIFESLINSVSQKVGV